MKILLKHYRGSKIGAVDEIDCDGQSEILLGRDETATVKFDPQVDDLVSRRHARITWTLNPPGFTLTDSGSSNGTYLNGQRLTEPVPLRFGQRVELGPNGPAFEVDFEPRPLDDLPSTRIVSAEELPGLFAPAMPASKAADKRRPGLPLSGSRQWVATLTVAALALLAVTQTWFRSATTPRLKPAPTSVADAKGIEEHHNGRRVALIIGNSRYRNIPALDNPGVDAQLIAETATRLGFTLVHGGPLFDLDRRGLEAAVQDLSRELQQASLEGGAGNSGGTVALFYYSGHGVQERGTNYLVPVDANPTKVSDFDFQMMDINVVLHQLEESSTALNMVVLDACRNNPFGGRAFRGPAGGLAEMKAPEGTMIVFATQSGNVARDGPPGGNSPFAQALAWGMQLPGVDQFGVFNSIAVQVKKATGGSQQPWMSNSPIEGRFFFLPDGDK